MNINKVVQLTGMKWSSRASCVFAVRLYE